MRTNASKFALSAIALALGLCQPAQAALLDVDRTQVAPAAPLWYQDAIGLKLQPCADGDINGPCAVEPGISQYWGAVSIHSAVNARLIMGIDNIAPIPAAPGVPADPGGIFNSILIRLDGMTPGVFTVTHPFGVTEVIVDATGRGLVEVLAGTLDPLAALGGPVSNYLYFANGVPLANPTFPGASYLGGGELVPGAIFGSPLGTNFFRIEGPGLPVGGVQENNFQIVGKVFAPAGAVLPKAMNDFAGTTPGVAVDIDARANDFPLVPTAAPTATDTIALNPASITPTAGATKVPYLDQMLLNFAPTVASGVQSFNYTIMDFAGRVTDPATVSVFVEDMKLNKASFRARNGKWSIGGNGNIRDLKVVNGAETSHFTNLVGAQEVPPVATAGYGKTTFTLRTDGVLGPVVDYSLNYTGLTAVTQAHLHSGAVGVNGGPHLFLCTNLAPPVGLPVPPACPATGGTVVGTLSAADFVAAGLVTTFAELSTAIAAGGTYVNVHTAANPTGEIRGQVGRNVVSLQAGTTGPVLGNAEVQANGSWSFTGKSVMSPAAAATIKATSSVGNAMTRDLQKR
ncbi:MAG: CHRD domain-containing protein [Sideroxyarcus sp.]|nr:CHRD domain-containing protein [Sideroxyarcus sp.]